MFLLRYLVLLKLTMFLSAASVLDKQLDVHFISSLQLIEMFDSFNVL